MQPALTAYTAVEGGLVFGIPNQGDPSRFPFATMPAGPGALVGGPGGVALGRFGFAHVDGRVTNERTAADDRIGLVIPAFTQAVLNTWQRNFWDRDTHTLRAREGTEVTLLTRGAVWVRFAGGAWPGQQVYASVLDGSAISGYADDAELTRWSVQTAAAPGELAVISTFAHFGV